MPTAGSRPPSLLRIQFDDQLFVDRQIDVFPFRESRDSSLVIVAIYFEPVHRRLMAGEFFRDLEHGHLLAVVTNNDFFADRNLIRRNVYLAPVYGNVSVTNKLASLAARNREAQAIDHVVEATLELFEQLRAGYALGARGLLEIVAELFFQREVDALGLLLLAELETVANDFGFAVFSVLSGSEVALLDGALIAEALGALEKKFHAFASAKATNWSFITCHCFFKPRVVAIGLQAALPFVPIS